MNTQLNEDPIGPLQPEKIVETLDKHQVKYLLMGGLAAVAYGSSRLTYDIDILPETAEENLQNLLKALCEMNVRLKAGESKSISGDLEIADLTRHQILQCRTDHGDIDIFSGQIQSGDNKSDYESLESRATKTEAFGYPLLLVSIDDIIDSKKAAGREKDVQDIRTLQAIKKRL